MQDGADMKVEIKGSTKRSGSDTEINPREHEKWRSRCIDQY